MDRRRFIAVAGGAAAVVGFDTVAGRWVRADEADACEHPFEHVPPLDGTLHLDLETRAKAETDMGNVKHVLPAAVLRPGSVLDVQKMVRYCRRHGVEVATRGQHHSMDGQSLTCGLVVESRWLDEVHAIAPTHAVVGAGITWKDLLARTLEHGLRPRGLTGFTGLSVGGTLSVGGCPMTNHTGGLGDHVRALQVVTGEGDLVDCSEHEHRDLFEAMLGGLGQCGVIVRATVDLVPARSMARTYLLTYADARPFFDDFRALFDRGEMDDCYNVCIPPGSHAFVYQINATVFFDPDAPPDDEHLLRDLSLPPALVAKTDRPYYEYATFVDQQIETLRVAMDWDGLVKPWYDVWLPDDTVEEHVREVVESATHEDVGVSGFVLLFAQRRSAMRRPFFRVPDARGADRVWLFDLATTSNLPGRDPAFAERMARRNRRLYERARALGGTRYPIGVLDFTRGDWARHFGEAWPAFVRAKRRYDPDRIMTPGPGIF